MGASPSYAAPFGLDGRSLNVVALANLYILGAPKCGTSTLTTWLRQHPDVFVPRLKEPHYFYSPYGPLCDRAEYEELYREAPEAASTRLDGSIWGLFGRTAAPRILDQVPEARFIVCLRNPVDMVPSLHAQKLLTGHEKIRDLQRAWDLSDDRASGSHVGIFGIPEGDPAHMSYKAACRLGEQVRDLLEVVDRSRVLIAFLEDIATAPDRTWRLVCEHAGLNPMPIEFDSANRTTVRRRSQLGYRVLAGAGSVKKVLGLTGRSGLLAPLHRLNIQEQRYTPPSTTLRREMADYFRDDIALLESIIEQDLGDWRTTDR